MNILYRASHIIWICILLIFGIYIQISKAADIYVGPSETYTTIQAAIDNSGTTNGDTIIVKDGTYNENIDVTKQLTIRSKDWIDNQENDKAIVAANAVTDHVFDVTADHVNIEGFTIYGGGGGVSGYIKSGIEISGAQYCTISNNRCGYDETHMNYRGITLSGANNNTVSDNTCKGNVDGMLVYSGQNNMVSGNTCTENEIGVYLDNTSGNTLSGNIFSSNYSPYGADGIGISLVNSNDNSVVRNTCNLNSDYGISLDNSRGNTIYLNNFSGNTTANVYSSGSTNTWQTPTEVRYNYTAGSIHEGYLGNYYDDHSGNDDDGDGIGSLKYITDGENDHYPLWQTSGHYTVMEGITIPGIPLLLLQD